MPDKVRNAADEEKNSPSAQPGASDKKLSDENVVAAHEQAEEDIAQDPELSIHSPNDDLDEGETARLGEDKTDLI